MITHSFLALHEAIVSGQGGGTVPRYGRNIAVESASDRTGL
jgi:hypothetical protein